MASLIRQIVEAQDDDEYEVLSKVSKKGTMSSEEEARAGREQAARMRGKLDKENIVARVSRHGESKHQVVLQFSGPVLHLGRVRDELKAMKDEDEIGFSVAM